MKRTSILLCILFTATANFIAPAAKAQVNTADSLALVDLYNSTNGPHWNRHDNWLTAKPVSTWRGVKVSGSHVSQVNLPVNRLIGALPASIGNFTNLRYLNLRSNQLSGTIPAEIGNLTTLTMLYLHGNHLTGAIPASIGNLKNLTTLYLNTNRLTSAIPAEIGNLKNLTTLFLTNNQLSGAVPASFNKLTSLSTMDLSYNRLSAFGNANPFGNNAALNGNVSNNLFTFSGLQVLANNYPDIAYAPQDTILPIHQNGNILSVSAGGTLSNNTYRWYKTGDTSKTVIQKDSTFSPAQNGMYYVTVTNKIATQLILYSDTISYTMPLVAQTNNSIAKAADVKTGNTHFSVYPNPASNLIHIQTTGTATIILTNAAGKTLLTKTINNSADINVSTYANGVYYIQNKTTGETQKIIITH